MPSLPPLPGALAARFRAQRVLGQGGFGTVLLAEDRELGREVAIKLLRGSLADLESRRRFEREAQLTARLEHPNLIRLFDHGVVADGDAWIAYEYLPGGSLEDRRARAGGRLPPADLRTYAQGLAAGLDALHAAGVVHRDLKPANVLHRADESPVLADLGLGRSQLSEGPRTATGLILGTPAFMAPELLRGEPATPASDQFGLAATLYLCATGQPVHGAVDVEGILRAVQDYRAPAGGPLPALARALARDPSARYPDCTTLADALARDPQPAPETAPRPRARPALAPRPDAAPPTLRPGEAPGPAALTPGSPGATPTPRTPHRPPRSASRRAAKGGRPSASRAGLRPALALAAALLAAVALGTWGPTRPAPPPTPAKPRLDPLQAERRADAQALDHLRQTFLDLGTVLGEAPPPDRWWDLPRPPRPRLRAALTDRRMMPAVRRATEALDAWLARPHSSLAHPDPGLERPLEAFSRLIGDADSAVSEVEKRLATFDLEGASTPEGAAFGEAFDQWEQIRPLFSALLRRQQTAEDRDPGRAVVGFVLARVLHHPTLNMWSRRVLADFSAAPEAERRPGLVLRRVASAVSNRFLFPPLPCKERLTMVPELVELSGSGLSPDARLRLAPAVLTAGMVVCTLCPEGLEDPTLRTALHAAAEDLLQVTADPAAMAPADPSDEREWQQALQRTWNLLSEQRSTWVGLGLQVDRLAAALDLHRNQPSAPSR